MNTTEPLRRIQPQPLTHREFSEFGAVVQHQGADRRHYLATPSERHVSAAVMGFWISRFETASPLPVPVTQLERHPFTAQTFVPLLATRFLIVVSPSRADGSPDLAGMRAFIGGPGQGISYRLGVWHAPFTLLDAPAEFAVIMGMTGRDDDTQLTDLPGPIEISAPAAREA